MSQTENLENVDGELIETTIELIEGHRGPDDTITSREISERLGGLDHLDSTPQTRKVIRAAVHCHGVPIGANGNGYFMIESVDQLVDYSNDLQDRIRGIRARHDAVVEAFLRRESES